MKSGTTLDTPTLAVATTNTASNDARTLEHIHRARIEELNRMGGLELVYYLDAHVDKGMRELANLLNNRWTFTTHACHGHWAPKVRRQDPYVVFRVLPNRISEWGECNDASSQG